MMRINHDWDETDTNDMLELAFLEYARACYGSRKISAVQNREVRQAFLSGIHWLNSLDDYDPAEIAAAICLLLFPRGNIQDKDHDNSD